MISETTLELSWKAVEHNLNYFKNKLNTGTKLMLMVKASAYGIGEIQLEEKVEEKKVCDYLAVAYLAEGIELRKNGIELPIMVLNPSHDSWEEMVLHCLEPEIHSIESLNSFIEYLNTHPSLSKKHYPIHLKFNTGMNRLGFEHSEVEMLESTMLKNNCVGVKSIMTHLSSTSLSKQDEFTHGQLDLFNKIISKLKKLVTNKTIIHALNSSGIERFNSFQYDMVRIGIGLYGASSDPLLSSKLIPICKLKTIISAVRKVKKGDSISYGRSGRAPRDGYVATLAIGYADGFNRNLSNQAWEVEIDGELYPIIGDICMDLSMVFLGDKKVNIGSEVLIFGGKKSIHDYASAQKTITYEALTSIGSRVKRTFID